MNILERLIELLLSVAHTQQFLVHVSRDLARDKQDISHLGNLRKLCQRRIHCRWVDVFDRHLNLSSLTDYVLIPD